VNFLLILLAAIIEFTIVSVEGLRSPRWSQDWARWLTGLFGGRHWWHGWIGAAVVIGVPMLVVAGGFTLLFETSRVLGHAASLAFLLLMLGPADLNRAVERHRQRATLGDDAPRAADEIDFLAQGRELPLGEASGDPQLDATRGELAALAVAADRAWFEPLFWFFVGGPVGALAYRLCANLGAAAESERSVASALAEAREALEWVPGRVTVLALGIAGTLMPVVETAQRVGLLDWGRTSELIGRAGLAAIDHGRIVEVISGDPRIYRLNLMHALVRRTLNVWLVFIAIGALLI
jgi:AmpE protein